MGKLAWERHAEKAPPILEQDIDDVARVVVRARPQAFSLQQRFVATVRYIKPPQKGQYVITYAYGATAAAAEVRALDAYHRQVSQAGQ